MSEIHQKVLFNKDDAFSIKLDDYRIINLLGKGSFGDVFLVEYKGKQYALKKMAYTSRHNDILNNEIGSLVFLNKQDDVKIGVPQLCCVFFENPALLIIVMEVIKGEELFEILNDHLVSVRKLNTLQLVQIFIKLFYRLHLLHEYGVAHYDIKPENIMISRDMNVIKFIDFGFSCVKELSKPLCFNTKKGSPGYISPDLFNIKDIEDYEKKYDVGIKNDIFSLGVIMYIFFEGNDIKLYKGTIKPNISLIEYTNMNKIIYDTSGDTKQRMVYYNVLKILSRSVFVHYSKRNMAHKIFRKLNNILKSIYGLEYNISTDKFIDKIISTPSASASSASASASSMPASASSAKPALTISVPAPMPSSASSSAKSALASSVPAHPMPASAFASVSPPMPASASSSTKSALATSVPVPMPASAFASSPAHPMPASAFASSPTHPMPASASSSTKSALATSVPASSKAVASTISPKDARTGAFSPAGNIYGGYKIIKKTYMSLKLLK